LADSEFWNTELQEELQEQVAGVPFEVLQQARSNGQVTSFTGAKKQHETKRANKNR
jgi:hypothetical protein